MTRRESDSVLEICSSRAAIIVCIGEARVLDALAPGSGAASFRVASDERWLVGPVTIAVELLARTRAQLTPIGLSALAVDVTDGWAVWTISGPGTDEVWARLSENRVPSARPAFVQGAVAGIPCKAIVQDGRIHFFTPAPVGHHLPQRILEACPDLGPRMAAATDLILDTSVTAPTNVPPGFAPQGARP
jgi:hypothetical protein